MPSSVVNSLNVTIFFNRLLFNFKALRRESSVALFSFTYTVQISASRVNEFPLL